MIHEDDRRILETWPEAKLITAKERCILGDHYHKIKTEKFVLLSGSVMMSILKGATTMMEIGKIYTVNPGERHTFDMWEGSVMIGLCSHEYNHNDDYK